VLDIIKRSWAIISIVILASFLRFYQITTIPVSLFGDELDVGYHAYSILKTGEDYYGNFMPLHFHSIAEWRTPLYLYASVPTVALFGISPLGVRLPAALFGIFGVLGFYLLIKEILTYNIKPGNKHPRALLGALIIAISPWHLQYSRAGFEVTMLLTFLIFGLYFFLKSFKDVKFLWVSVLLLTLTPWIYSTAKLFTPLLLIILFIIWRKEINLFSLESKIKAIIVGLIVGLPIAYSTFFGGGAERAAYTSIFTDPTVAPEIGVSRSLDAKMRGENTLGLTPTFFDRAVHNKVVSISKTFINNYLEAFSTEFLFVEGDPNLRHSPKGIGQFFRIDFLALVLGLLLFFKSSQHIKIKMLILSWILLGALPSALTRDGGNHATRLILMLPPMAFLISYGVIESYRQLATRFRIFFIFTYFLTLALSFIFYLHNYYVHYPWDSERWWHYGFEESVKTIKSIDKDFDKVIISMSGEPAWIFFGSWYEYDPSIWHNEFPIGNDGELSGFGKVSHIGKFYFSAVPDEVGIFGLGRIIDNKTLYLANASEIGENLVTNPERGPGDLELIKAIAYPSGEPAYYLFKKR
jgi:hypothetical protein